MFLVLPFQSTREVSFKFFQLFSGQHQLHCKMFQSMGTPKSHNYLELSSFLNLMHTGQDHCFVSSTRPSFQINTLNVYISCD